MHAFVGADRNRPLDPRQRFIPAGGQRLLDQRDAGLGAGGEILLEIVLGPGFVGIDDEFGSGAALRTAAMRSPSPSPPSLILSSGRCAALAVAAAIASGEPSEMV